MTKMAEAIRKAVEASPKSRYRLAREAGIQESALSRLLSGERSLSAEGIEKMAEALGLEIIIRPKGRGKPKTKKAGK